MSLSLFLSPLRLFKRTKAARDTEGREPVAVDDVRIDARVVKKDLDTLLRTTARRDIQRRRPIFRRVVRVDAAVGEKELDDGEVT